MESTLPSLYNCTDDNLITVLSRSVSILQYPVVNESVVTDSGLVRPCVCGGGVCKYIALQS